MDRRRLAIVIPAFNEEKTISNIILNVIQYGIPVVVDDGSSDATRKFAESSGAQVVTHEQNMGYDSALNSGFAKANEIGCEYVITMDADGQHNPSLLKDFIEYLDDGYDVVIGIRDKQQRVAERIFSWIAWVKWKIKDPLCGMKGYRIGVYQALGHFDSYKSIGTELTIFAAKSGMKIKQLPIVTRERQDLPRFGSRFSANKRILCALFYALLLKVN